MLKKASHKNDAAVDVPADNPERAMEQFTDGLRRVLSTKKKIPKRVKPHARRGT